jgi:hypothetical protein
MWRISKLNHLIHPSVVLEKECKESKYLSGFEFRIRTTEIHYVYKQRKEINGNSNLQICAYYFFLDTVSYSGEQKYYFIYFVSFASCSFLKSEQVYIIYSWINNYMKCSKYLYIVRISLSTATYIEMHTFHLHMNAYPYNRMYIKFLSLYLDSFWNSVISWNFRVRSGTKNSKVQLNHKIKYTNESVYTQQFYLY